MPTRIRCWSSSTSATPPSRRRRSSCSVIRRSTPINRINVTRRRPRRRNGSGRRRRHSQYGAAAIGRSGGADGREPMRGMVRALVACLITVTAVAVVRGAGRMFPGPATDTNPRANTPNDPDFDKAEPDDEDGDFVPGQFSVFDEANRLFGFAPNSTSATARYLDPRNPRVGQPQVSGVSADLAWKLSIGEQNVAVAICDTGIVWSNQELRRRVRLNTGELAVPNPDS